MKFLALCSFALSIHLAYTRNTPQQMDSGMSTGPYYCKSDQSVCAGQVTAQPGMCCHPGDQLSITSSLNGFFDNTCLCNWVTLIDKEEYPCTDNAIVCQYAGYPSGTQRCCSPFHNMVVSSSTDGTHGHDCLCRKPTRMPEEDC